MVEEIILPANEELFGSVGFPGSHQCPYRTVRAGLYQEVQVIGHDDMGMTEPALNLVVVANGKDKIVSHRNQRWAISGQRALGDIEMALEGMDMWGKRVAETSGHGADMRSARLGHKLIGA